MGGIPDRALTEEPDDFGYSLVVENFDNDGGADLAIDVLH